MKSFLNVQNPAQTLFGQFLELLGAYTPMLFYHGFLAIIASKYGSFSVAPTLSKRLSTLA